MARAAWLTVPNLITLFRLALVPVFVFLHLKGFPALALGVFALAAASDGLDGLLARLLDQRTALGAFLDPLADKVLAFAALSSLVIERRLPVWLWALIVFRDGFMILGTVVVRRKGLDLPQQPSRVGKYATFALVVLVVMALADQADAPLPQLHAYTRVVGVLAGFAVAVSTLQYFTRFGYLFFAPPRRKPD